MPPELFFFVAVFAGAPFLAGSLPLDTGSRGRRCHQLTDRLHLPGRGETPVEEAARLFVDGVALARVGVHDGDQQHLAVPLGDPCEGGAGVGGVAVLDAGDALVGGDAVVPGEQPVGVLDLEVAALLARYLLAGELGAGRGAVLPEVLLLHAAARDEGEVVRGGDLAVGVVAVGRDDMGVEGLELLGVCLHVLDGLGDAAVHLGEHVHGVVAGAQEHAEPQVVDGVRLVLLDPDQTAALADLREFGLGDQVDLGLGQAGEDGVREQHLERGRRGQPPVGVV